MWKLFFSVLPVFFFAVETLHAQGRHYALFFAVEDYQYDSYWTDLRNPLSDAQAIARELQTNYGFQAPDIRENPSQSDIIATLRTYATRSFGPQDQLFIFFTGHGYFDELLKEGYFIPRDGRSNDQTGNSYLPHTRLERIIDQLPCPHILLAIDACYSGTFDEAIALAKDPNEQPLKGLRTDPEKERQAFIQRKLRYQSRLYLTSGGKERTPDGTRYSPFTARLLEALRSFGGGDRVLTFTELLGFMEKARPEPRSGQFGREHEPGGTFLFLSTLGGVVSSPTTPAVTPAPVPVKPVVTTGYVDEHDMVFIKGGTFQMGDTFGEGQSDEKPTHSVTVGDYWLARTEVTVQDFADFVAATGYRTTAEIEGFSYAWNGKEWEKKDGLNWRYHAKGELHKTSDYNHPVIHVSWYDALEYCNWKSRQDALEPVYRIDKTRKDPNNQNNNDNYKWTVSWSPGANGYRLPTEAEWEFAARSRGKAYKYAWGNGDPTGSLRDETVAKTFGWSNIWKGYTDGYAYTAPVGVFAQGDLGLTDMTGNVWEWCWDWYGENYYGQSSNARDPKGPSLGQHRVVRGGSWDYDPGHCRAANRDRGRPGGRNVGDGFRLARN